VVVSGVSLDIEPGEFVSLLGPSGSGKTTTLMMIAGFQHPRSGTITMDGRELSAAKPQDRGIGVVFQSYALFPHMSVAQNVAYPLKIRRVPKATINARVAEVLDMVRLPDSEFGRRRPFELSGGQQQRVAMARALVFEPRLLLMDEPMGALDKGLRADLQAELKLLHQRIGVSIIYVTHDQEEAMFLSDRIALFNHGEIVQVGTPRELYTNPKTPFVARFLGEANVVSVGATLAQAPVAVRDSFAEQATASAVRPVEWMIRPEHIRLVAPEAGIVSGRVEQLTYLGATLRISVATASGTIAVRLASDAVESLAEGDTVGLTWKESAAIPWAG
jgi:putative spermidine/putrescine transport system ATP-binding protein